VVVAQVVSGSRYEIAMHENDPLVLLRQKACLSLSWLLAALTARGGLGADRAADRTAHA
jgi:hypothetical protein